MGDENTEVEDVEVEDEHSDIEKEAMSKGWKPEGVPGKRNMSAEEFLDRERFFGRIHALEKKNQQLDATLNEMSKQQRKIAELERTKVLDELKRQKKEAMENQEFDKVIELDDKIVETKAIKTEDIEVPRAETNEHPLFAAWRARNSWYDTDPEMHEDAEDLGRAYVARNPTADGPTVWAHVERKIKQLHRDKFEAPNAGNRSQDVERPARGSTRREAKKFSARDLNPQQRAVMNRLVSRGDMTEQEYIDSLVSIGEL